MTYNELESLKLNDNISINGDLEMFIVYSGHKEIYMVRQNKSDDLLKNQTFLVQDFNSPHKMNKNLHFVQLKGWLQKLVSKVF